MNISGKFNVLKVGALGSILLLMLTGCTRESVEERQTREVEGELRKAYQEMPGVLANVTNLYGLLGQGKKMANLISCLPTDQQRGEWYLRTRAMLDSQNISNLSYRLQCRAISQVDGMRRELGFREFLKNADKLVFWKLRLQALAWERSQIVRLVEEFNRGNVEGGLPAGELKELDGILGSVITHYHNIEDYAEYDFCYDVAERPKEEMEEVRRIFEGILGRPIRAGEQISLEKRKRKEKAYRLQLYSTPPNKNRVTGK